MRYCGPVRRHVLVTKPCSAQDPHIIRPPHVLGPQVTAVKAQPQAADRALIADVRRLLKHLPCPTPQPSGRAACPASHPTHDPARRPSWSPDASCTRQEPAGSHDPRACKLDAAEGRHVGAPAAAPVHAEQQPPEPGAAVRGDAGAAAPVTVHADWLPRGAWHTAAPAGQGSLHVQQAGPACVGTRQKPAVQLKASGGECSAGHSAEPSSAAPEHDVLAPGDSPLRAAQPERWLMIISDDADFAATVRAAAAAGWRTVVVGDRPGAGADADMCLSWQEVQGLVP